MSQHKTYFQSGDFIVRDHGVIVRDKDFPIADIGPVRAFRWRGRHAYVVDLTTRTGGTLAAVEFPANDPVAGANFAAAVNQAVADSGGPNVPAPALSAKPERAAFDLILMIAGGIIAAGVILWLLAAII